MTATRTVAKLGWIYGDGRSTSIEIRTVYDLLEANFRSFP